MSTSQHKLVTMYYSEGNTVAVVTSGEGKDRTRRTIPMADAQAAYKWCQEHKAFLVLNQEERSSN